MERLSGRVALVTGAASGIGYAIAARLASEGATVLVNDRDASACSRAAAELGGLAAVGDVTSPEDMAAVVALADGLDIVVNNAGITRDKMLFNMSDEDWDAVIAVHLRGHFLLTRNAATYWRAKAKEGDGSVYGRIINTSSEAGLVGPVGQANYGAAKAGITALTLTAARALERYGVRANAICPRARTAMTADVFGDAPELAEGETDSLSPEHVVSLVRFLASPASDGVSGQVFIVYGPTVTLVAAPTVEQQFTADGSAWVPAELSGTLREFFAGRDLEQGFSATGLMGNS
jgi:NAD(P)-dependent dehydrogenase (short-subunit alcohol dehydrogenase family)